MTDQYARIREALAMGPTPGPWQDIGPIGAGKLIKAPEGLIAVVYGPNVNPASEANAHLIAACDPDTIRALLEERDALKAENDRLHEQLRLATVDQAIAEAEASDAHAENKRLQESLAALEQEAGRG